MMLSLFETINIQLQIQLELVDDAKARSGG